MFVTFGGGVKFWRSLDFILPFWALSVDTYIGRFVTLPVQGLQKHQKIIIMTLKLLDPTLSVTRTEMATPVL